MAGSRGICDRTHVTGLRLDAARRLRLGPSGPTREAPFTGVLGFNPWQLDGAPDGTLRIYRWEEITEAPRGSERHRATNLERWQHTAIISRGEGRRYA